VERCVVTGASGLVGRELVEALVAGGKSVQAWQRSTPAAPVPGVAYRAFELGAAHNDDVERELAGADVFIHCAWDLRVATWEDIERVNVRGSIAWFDAAARAGVKKLIFVSSVSAYDGCQSMYGRSKLLVEAAVARHGGVSVRPGIVHGDPNAGVYGRLYKSTDGAVIPLIDGGHQRMLTVHRQDLARTVSTLIDHYQTWTGRVIVVGHPRLVSMRELLERIARSRGRAVRFVPVPGSAVMMALRTAERMGVQLQFRSDSLVTLRGPEPVVDPTVLAELGVPLRSLEDALATSAPAPAVTVDGAECEALSRYFVGRACPADVAERYARAVRDLGLQLSPVQQLMWNAACRIQPLLSALDAGVALWDRHGVVRKRLLVMFVLLEATPQNVDRFLFVPRGAGGHARTLLRCLMAPFAILAGTPLGLASRLTGAKR
jgi:nucleoside-diphosphate-sugar epimerase